MDTDGDDAKFGERNTYDLPDLNHSLMYCVYSALLSFISLDVFFTVLVTNYIMCDSGPIKAM